MVIFHSYVKLPEGIQPKKHCKIQIQKILFQTKFWGEIPPASSMIKGHVSWCSAPMASKQPFFWLNFVKSRRIWIPTIPNSWISWISWMIWGYLGYPNDLGNLPIPMFPDFLVLHETLKVRGRHTAEEGNLIHLPGWTFGERGGSSLEHVCM